MLAGRGKSMLAQAVIPQAPSTAFQAVPLPRCATLRVGGFK
jgi:hypothetical protein